MSAQLLKSIPAEGRFSDIIAKTLPNIQYVPIRTKSFEVVEVLLRDNTGDPMPFERGMVVITLHFRKHSYFTEMSNPYVRYPDQQGHGMTVFRGSPWQLVMVKSGMDWVVCFVALLEPSCLWLKVEQKLLEILL